ncbi:MAG: glycosyltransferase [Acholeplasmataceae bacterium]|nr:glycosyltransferase [Acholeplasmataceae bacterium]
MMISLIIPTYNRAGLTKECVSDALKNRTDLEVIWVDDGSTDGVIDVMKEIQPDISVMKKKNKGVANSYNTGMRLSRGDWIALMDSDFLMPDGWLEKLKEYISKTPDADIICIGINGFDRYIGEEIEINGVKVRETKSIIGFYAISRKFFEKIGYFSEDMGWYAPIDAQFSQRAKKLGAKSYYIPDIKIYHRGIGAWDSGEYRIKKDESLKKLKVVVEELYYNPYAI